MKNLTIHRETIAAELLADPAFCAQWAELRKRCTWSTSYQSPAFAGTWYRVYAAKFEPVLVTAQSESGELCGILCLAVSRTDGELVAAGSSQAEYQSWLSDPSCDNEFPLAAVQALREEFPSSLLEFRYLPPGAPLDWLADSSLKSRFVLTSKQRPLLRFAEITADSLNKANNKKRLKGLKKLGQLEFRRLTTTDELANFMDDFTDFYDLRLGAMHGIEPFAQDPLKKSFQLELMNEPGLLHVTVLKAGDLLASAHLNVSDGKQLHLNLIGYNPILARHSPGKFHIHMLSQMAFAQGYEELDLTPGGDPYKERFSNAHDTAFVLSFHPTAPSRMKRIIASRGESWARYGLSAAGVHPARARSVLEDLRGSPVRDIVSPLVARLRNHIHSQREIKIYTRRLTRNIEPHAGVDIFRRDAIEDLSAYEPPPNGTSRKHFLLDASNRLEEGQHLYTSVRDQRLTYVGWLMERPSNVFLARVCPGASLPAAVALIMDMYAGGPIQGADLGPACLAAMLADLSRTNGIAQVAMIVPSSGRQIPLLEAAGFSWDRSLFVRTTFGHVRRWTWQASAPAVFGARIMPTP